MSAQLIVDAFELARSARSVAAAVDWHELPRLCAATHDSGAAPAASSSAIDWRLTGSSDATAAGGRRDWLKLHARFSVPLTCVRCLDAVVAPVEFERRFLLVADEATAERLDADVDDYDVLAGSRHFDVLRLLEDEALLALPIAPRHADCGLPGRAAAARDEPGAAAARGADPFAVLQRLRRGTTGSKDS